MPFWHHNVTDVSTPKRHKKIQKSKRAAIYFPLEVHQALRMRAAVTGTSISQMVNATVRVALAEDAEDLDAFDLHREEKDMSFESFICGLRRRGRL